MSSTMRSDEGVTRTVNGTGHTGSGRVRREFVVERRAARLRIIGGGQGLPASLNFAGRRLVLGRRPVAGRHGLRAPELLGARTARLL